jgi:hypothetical protein
MQNTSANEFNGKWNTTIEFAKKKNPFLSRETILRSIDLCMVNDKDNLGRTILHFYEAVFYRANQIWLATGF